MTLPSPGTPLYNHSLPKIEQWLKDLGCAQDPEERHTWTIQQQSSTSEEWKAQILLEVQEITVCYLAVGKDQADIRRSFKYSLSRQDIEDAIFAGP